MENIAVLVELDISVFSPSPSSHTHHNSESHEKFNEWPAEKSETT